MLVATEDKLMQLDACTGKLLWQSMQESFLFGPSPPALIFSSVLKKSTYAHKLLHLLSLHARLKLSLFGICEPVDGLAEELREASGRAAHPSILTDFIGKVWVVGRECKFQGKFSLNNRALLMVLWSIQVRLIVESLSCSTDTEIWSWLPVMPCP